jgi:aspartate aminotransferase
VGKRTPSGQTIATIEDIRTYLLSEARMAVIPFHAFGSGADVDWFRLSVGAVSKKDIEDMFPRLRRALEALS